MKNKLKIRHFVFMALLAGAYMAFLQAWHISIAVLFITTLTFVLAIIQQRFRWPKFERLIVIPLARIMASSSIINKINPAYKAYLIDAGKRGLIDRAQESKEVKKLAKNQ